MDPVKSGYFGRIRVLAMKLPCVQEVVTPFYIVTYYIQWGNYFLDTRHLLSKLDKKYDTKNEEAKLCGLMFQTNLLGYIGEHNKY